MAAGHPVELLEKGLDRSTPRCKIIDRGEPIPGSIPERFEGHRLPAEGPVPWKEVEGPVPALDQHDERGDAWPSSAEQLPRCPIPVVTIEDQETNRGQKVADLRA